MASQDEGQRARRQAPEASVLAHAVTGGLEGAAGIYGTEPLLNRYLGPERKWTNPFKEGPGLLKALKGHGRKLAIGAAVGAATTAPIGALVEAIRKKRQKQNSSELERVQDFVVELRKRYVLVDENEEEGQDAAVLRIPGDSKAHAAIKGGLVGAAAGGAVGIGATIGLPLAAKRLGLQKSVRSVEHILGGKRGARITSIVGTGLAAKIGATAGAIQGVASYNKADQRSKAIARALRKAREEGAQKNMSLQEKVTMLENDYAKRSGVRLDKYEKTIRAREIDRHTTDYLRSAGLGAVTGATIAGTRSLRKGALIGAGVGTAAQALLHAAGHRDPYGEQSEDAKIIQRQVPKYLAGAAIIGSVVARHRKLKIPVT